MCYDVLLWGKNDSSLHGDATHLQSLPHRFIADGRYIPVVYYSNELYLCLLKTCIFLLEKLHLEERSSTSSTNTNLYCEAGTTLDLQTDFAVKPGNTQTVPFPRVRQEAAVQLIRTMANTPRYMDFILCVGSQPCKRFLET